MSDTKLLWKRDWLWSNIWTAYRADDGLYVGTVRPFGGGGVMAHIGNAHGHFMNAEYGKRFVEAQYGKREA